MVAQFLCANWSSEIGIRSRLWKVKYTVIPRATTKKTKNKKTNPHIHTKLYNDPGKREMMLGGGEPRQG